MPAKKERVFALYWDESDEKDDSYTKERRSLHATLEEAVAQATHDIENGFRRIVRVEEFAADDLKKFHQESKGQPNPDLPQGKSVWTPEDLS